RGAASAGAGIRCHPFGGARSARGLARRRRAGRAHAAAPDRPAAPCARPGRRSSSSARSRRAPADYCVAILKFFSDSWSSTPVVPTKAPFFAFQRQVSLTAVLLYFGGFWPSPQSDSPGLVSMVTVMTKAWYSDLLSGRVA